MFTDFFVFLREIPYGLAVRMPGFHPGGPGSTPGMGTHILSAHTYIDVAQLPSLSLLFVFTYFCKSSFV